MEIKSSKDYIFIGPIMVILVTLSALVLANMGYIMVAAIVFSLCIAGSISYSITVGRTIFMDQNGVYIKFYKLTRIYQWNDLMIKRVEGPHMGLRNTNTNGGVFFSHKKVRKPMFVDPSLYCSVFHPISCFFVYFSPTESNGEAKDGIYPVNMEHFLAQLNEWGVKLD